jgi:hypothetical protein
MAKAFSTGYERIVHLARPVPGRVQPAGHRVQAFHCSLLAREMSAGPDGSPISGIQRFDRVGRADHCSDLDVVVEEWNEFVRLRLADVATIAKGLP